MAAFLERRAGVLEMATGTGKTRTTLKILDRLIGDGVIEAAIIAIDGVDCSISGAPNLTLGH